MNRHTFQRLFQTEESVVDYIIENCYHNEIKCPICGETHRLTKEKGRIKFFHCNKCNNSFSIFTGTIFHKTHMPLVDWMFAINLFMQARKGTSALQLSRELGVTYKTAWRINHQIRKAMADSNFADQFECIVEIDETYVGGKPRHSVAHDDDTKPQNKRGRGCSKTPIVGIKERGSKRVYAQVMLPNEEGKCLSSKQLFGILADTCKDGTIVMSDEFKGYNLLDKPNPKNFIRLKVNHSLHEYSNLHGICTNGIEGFWANIKRGIYGIFHHISLKHMQKYIDEFCYRQNNFLDSCNSIDAFNNLLFDSVKFGNQL